MLKKFYTTVRPWGFWEPVYRKVKMENPDFQKNRDFGRDCFNVLIGMIWQMALITFPMFLVIHETNLALYSLAVALVTTIVLKVNWWDRLED